jgi:hypothetical protein
VVRVTELPGGLLVTGDDPRRGATTAPTVRFSSRTLETTSDRDRKLATEGSKAWQNEAWTYFDEVEEVKYAAGFRGALMSRLLLYAGFVLQPDQPPVPIGDVPAGVLPAGFADAAIEELSRLGTIDQQAGLFNSWGSIATISGESYLVGKVDELAETGERWRLFSEQNIVRSPTGRGVAVREKPGGPPEPVDPDNDFVSRVWRPHARWPALPDANTRSVLATAEELLIYARQFRAVGKSRNSAGLLYMANEIGDLPNSDGTPNGFETRLVQSQATAISEDGAPSAAIPHIVRGPAAFGTGQRQVSAKDAIFHIPLDRKIDEKAVERISFLIQRLAHGLDVPVEILTGIADINHWGAWQIEDSTYKAHIEPDALTFATAITAEIIRPGLIDRFGPDALPLIRRVVAAVNPANLVVRPNRAQDAKEAHNAGAISNEALRRYLSFPETDAPTSEEMLLRLVLERSIGSATLTAPMLAATGLFPNVMAGLAEAADALDTTDDTDTDQGDPQPTPATQDQPTPNPDDQPTNDAGQARAIPVQLTLALPPPPTDAPVSQQLRTTTTTASSLGERLAAADRALTDRLLLAASETATTALRVLGQRLRAQAQGDPDRAAAIQGVPNEQVAAALLAAGHTLPDLAPLIEDQFDTLHTRWGSWVAASFDSTAATVAAAVDVADPQADATRTAATAQVRDDQDQRTGLGWAALLAALSRHVTATATGTAPAPQGETDDLVGIPYGIVRDALAATGGIAAPGSQPRGLAGEIGPGSTVGGLATGPSTMRALRIVGYTVTAWTWNHGSSTAPFPPHSALDGVTFSDWDDDVLINAAGWPPFSTYFPGDHVGCTCTPLPVFAPLTEG